MKTLFSICSVVILFIQPLHAQIKPSRGLMQAVQKIPAAATPKIPSQAVKAAAAVSWEKYGIRSTDEMEALYDSKLPVSAEPFYDSPQSVILDKYDRFFGYNTPLPNAVSVPSPEHFLYLKQARAALTAPFPALTDQDKLIHYYKLNPTQIENYQSLYHRLIQFHVYVLKRISPFLSVSTPQWTPTEKHSFDVELSSVERSVHQMLTHMGSLDPVLERTLTDIQWSRELISNMPGQFVMQNIKRTAPFNFKQYCLFSAPGAMPVHAIRNDDLFFNPELARQTAHEFCAQLPANLKVAVLNDSPVFTGQYTQWSNKGVFSNGMTVTTFLSLNDFLKAHRENRFDIILTDYFIPGGGGNLLVKMLRAEHDFTPILLHSYAGAGHNAWEISRQPGILQKEYLMGYDGYLPTNDDFFSSRGYLYILEALRNFYAAPKIQPSQP